MKRIAFLAAMLMGIMAGEARSEAPVVASSPDGRVKIEFSLRKASETEAVRHCRVTFDGTEVVGQSQLGVELESEAALGGPCEVVSVDARSVRDEFTQVTGKRRLVRFDATEVTVSLWETTGSKRRWDVQLRASDDGVAFRYALPQQDGRDTLVIKQERTEFRVPADARTFALPLNGFTNSYEKRYQLRPVNELPKDWLLGLPLLLECRSGTWAAITEANISEYAGLYLAPSGGGLLSTRLSPLPKERGLAVRHPLPHRSPWRVVMLGDRVGRLVESDIVVAWSEPCAIKDTSWVKTGKTTFPWWNGFYEEKLDFKPGLNTATAKHYIDFCADRTRHSHPMGTFRRRNRS